MVASGVCYYMPYCPNCSEGVGDTHRYCGRCGQPLGGGREDTDGIPPAGTAGRRDGFLSGRSIVYLGDLMQGEAEIDRESIEYAQLAQDVGNGFADLLYVAAVEDINPLVLLAHNVSDSRILSTESEALTSNQLHQQAMVTGFLKVPEIYDRALGTEWKDELTARLSDLVEKMEQLNDEQESEDDSDSVA